MGLGHVSVGGTAASSRFPEFNSGDMSLLRVMIFYHVQSRAESFPWPTRLSVSPATWLLSLSLCPCTH